MIEVNIMSKNIVNDGFGLIIAAGAFDDYDAHRAILAQAPAPRRIYCADGGLRHMAPLGLSPDVILGDFDSAEPALLDKYRMGDALLERHPADKDYTDTELAADRAVRDGCGAILILGALGRRIDHTYTNIQLAYKYALRGVRVALADPYGIAAVLVPGYAMEIVSDRPLASLLGLLENEKNVPSCLGRGTPNANHAAGGAPRFKLSLLPIGGAACGVTTSGLKYALKGADLESCYTSGVSNEFTSAHATVEIIEGALLIMACAD